MKTILRLGLPGLALALAFAGCTTPTATKEYNEETRKIISQEPVLGGARPASAGR